MGGYGSGWQGPKRATVEDSLVLSVSALMRAGALVPGERMGGTWGWTYEGEDRPHAIVRYEADLTEPDDPWLRLRYCVNGERVDCMVRLVTHAAELRRPPVVVRLPARGAPGCEALPAAGRQALREPRGLRADLCVLPGEREPAHRRPSPRMWARASRGFAGRCAHWASSAGGRGPVAPATVAQSLGLSGLHVSS